MQLTILDGHAVNPGDLSWDCLKPFGTLTVYPRTEPDLVIDRARGADAVFTNKVAFDETVLAALPDLKYIGVFATGYNLIDVGAAKRRGVVVTNIPSYSTESVAQTTWAHLLNLSLRLTEHVDSVRDGDWARSPDFCYWYGRLVELHGLTFGVVGYGEIGRRVARLAEAFGMNVLACGPRLREGDRDGAVRFVAFETLLTESDVVSLHCPLKPDNQEMIDAAALGRMKPTAFFLNMARGALVDEAALAEALNQGRLAGAGLDVLAQEPPAASNPLLTAKNCHISPHFAWGTLAARKRLQQIAVDNFRAFLRGEALNVVDAG